MFNPKYDNESATEKSENNTVPFINLQETKNEINRQAKKLNKILNNTYYLVAYEDYCKQIPLDSIIGKKNAFAKEIIQQFIKTFDINSSNDYGITLLHNLIFFNRPDLAELILQTNNFEKINFKLCMPYITGVMYASALDLAIMNWLGKKTDINFIETLLKYGALPPEPGKKFITEELLTYFFPIIACNNINEIADLRTKEEAIELFSLLHRYGFSTDDLIKNFKERLFDTNDLNNFSLEFEEQFSTSVEDQKKSLAEFEKNLNLAVTQDNQKGERLVELTAEKLDNGRDSLNLPFDPFDRPCVIM